MSDILLTTVGQTFAIFHEGVHFGETMCGLIEDSDMGPVLRVAEGERPYPEVMNESVIEAMQAANLDVVLVKGDLTSHGSFEVYRQ